MPETLELFDSASVTPANPLKCAPAIDLDDRPLRLSRANRAQLLLRPMDLDATLPPDHEARIFWRFVEQFDLTKFYEPYRAREGLRVGRRLTRRS